MSEAILDHQCADCGAWLSVRVGPRCISCASPETQPAPAEPAQPVTTALLVALGAFLEDCYSAPHRFVDEGLRERARELRAVLASEVDP